MQQHKLKHSSELQQPFIKVLAVTICTHDSLLQAVLTSSSRTTYVTCNHRETIGNCPSCKNPIAALLDWLSGAPSAIAAGVTGNQAFDNLVGQQAFMSQMLSCDRRCVVLHQPVLDCSCFIGVPISSYHRLPHLHLQSSVSLKKKTQLAYAVGMCTRPSLCSYMLNNGPMFLVRIWSNISWTTLPLARSQGQFETVNDTSNFKVS